MRIAAPLTLPCGVTLRDRIAKAPMTEGLANERDDATEALATLYRRWAEPGAGLLVTGNVMVDRRFLERSGNVVVDAASDEGALRAWSDAGSASDTLLMAQLSHPGRQCTRFHASEPVAPSPVPLAIGGFFARPRALEAYEIEALVDAFAGAAGRLKAAGFGAVQVHAAHGYLVSQFLSPRTNRRDDAWGGPLERRARFLLDIVAAVRRAVGPHFPVAVKLNAADFLRGGFEHHEAVSVARWLAEAGIDLLEVSGGTYERVAFVDDHARASASREREAYFQRYARDLKEALGAVPLMLSGGFRTPAAMETALASGEVDVIGLGRPFCVLPDVAARLRSGERARLPTPERRLRVGPGPFGPASPSRLVRSLNAQGATAWFYEQQVRLAHGAAPEARPGWAGAVLTRHLWQEIRRARARRRRRLVPVA